MTVGTARPVSITRTIDPDGWTTYVAVYEVFVTDPFEFPDDISTAPGIPNWGDPLTWGARTNNDVFCSNKVVNPVEINATNLKRTVTCTFTNKSGGRARTSNQIVTNPIQEPWKVGGNYATGTRNTWLNKDGIPIVTTGLEPKSFEVPDGYITIHLEGPSPNMSVIQWMQAEGRCNSTTMWGNLTARMVYLSQWTWNELFHGGTQYFYHRMEFWLKYVGWNEFWMNDGSQEYISGNPIGKRIVPILASNDSLGRNVRFLDIDGRIVPDSAVQNNILLGIPNPPVSGSLNPRTTQIIPEFDFTVLTASIGMPNPLPGNFV